MGESRLLRRGLIVVLVGLLFFSVTAYAFSGIYREHWSSRLEKGEYKGPDEPSSVFVIVAAEESTPTDVIISEPIQIIMAIPDGVEEVVENTDEIVGE